ncbi:MAG TPA: fibronectin type III domain-containing protein, partial [Candidatus Polarisedimenticolia bacterium]|nr:fibronectin type III domain-containing protein [Candidatus Polarisedimenticolia bacterium]
MQAPHFLRLAGIVVLAGLSSCHRFTATSSGSSVPRPPLPPPPQVNAAGFAGVRQLTPRADGVLVEWDPILEAGGASADFAYQVFLAVGGQPFDFQSPAVTTAPAADRAQLDGLADGTRYEVVVRALALNDPTDVDLNEVALGGVVTRLWYVAAGASGDGTDPSRPFGSINQAVVAVFQSGAPGNVLIAGGTYPEQVALLGDIHLFGAFLPGFAAGRDRATRPTILRPQASASVVLRILASAQPTFLDGLELDGQGSITNVLDVREADLQLSNGSIFAAAREGLTASSGNRTSLLRVHRMQISGCGSEGMEAAGSFDAALVTSAFTGNAH